MAISRMSRVYIFLPAQDQARLVTALAGLGVVEITPVPAGESGFFPAGVARSTGPDANAATVALLKRLVEYLAPEEPLSPPAVRESAVASFAAGFNLEEFAADARAVEQREAEIASLAQHLEKSAEIVSLCADCPGPLKNLVSPGEATAGAIGRGLFRISAGKSAGLESALTGRAAGFVVVQAGRKEAVILLAWHESEAGTVAGHLNRVKAEAVPVPAWRTDAAGSAARLTGASARVARRRTALAARKARLRRELPRLFARLDLALMAQAQQASHRNIISSGRTACLAGWLRDRDRSLLDGFLSRSFPDTFILARPPVRGEEVPVALENGPAGRPYEAVVDLYGRTAYEGTDPSPYLAFFFALIFALCLADVGYGLFLVVLSLWLKRRFTSDTARRMLRVFTFSGFATILAGAATNSFFGNLFGTFPAFRALGDIQARLALASPADNPADTMRFFYFALGLGYAQITFGLILNLRSRLRREGLAGLAEALPGLSFQLGVPLLIILLFKRTSLLWAENAVRALLIVLAVSAATVFYRQFQLYRDIVQRLFWSVYTVYNLVVGNLISDVLSYARIFALGLTSALLAVTVNQLALMAGAAPLVGLPVALLVLLGGHTFNLFISTLGAYVHTSRLQYLEFFNKFYLGGGRPFEPLRKNYRYLKVE